MSKALFRFIILSCVVSMTLCVVSPAQVTTKPTTPQVKQVPMGARVLPKNEAQKKEFAQWQQLYGYGQDSHTYYNLAVLIAGTDQHGKIINRNISYINMILAADDPNSLASMVVKNHNAINALAEENAELRTIINVLSRQQDPNGADAALIRGILYRLDALERLTRFMPERDPTSVGIWDGMVSEMCADPDCVIWHLKPDPNEVPVTSCNEQWGEGCGWNYYKCSLHSQNYKAPPNEITFTAIDSPITLPYIYDNPNFIGNGSFDISTVCTKHGRLSAEQPISFAGRRYCYRCVSEVAAQYFDRYIGMDPNEQGGDTFNE